MDARTMQRLEPVCQPEHDRFGRNRRNFGGKRKRATTIVVWDGKSSADMNIAFVGGQNEGNGAAVHAADS